MNPCKFKACGGFLMPEIRWLRTPENSSNLANNTQVIYRQYTEEIYKNNGKMSENK